MQEIQHLGVLTGSPITDMKLTLVTGKSHLKHTEAEILEKQPIEQFDKA